MGAGCWVFVGFCWGAAGRWGRLARGVGREVYFMKVVHCALVAQCSPVSLGLKLVLNNVGCLVTFASSGAWRKPFFRKKKCLVWSQGQQVALRCEGGDGLTEIAGVTGATGDGDDGDDGADRRHWRDGRLG